MYSDVLLSISKLQNEINELPGIVAGFDQEDAFSEMITDIGLKKHTEKLFRDGHHARAVEEAFKYLDNIVKKTAQLKENKLTGAPLMNRVFSASTPILKLNAGISQSEQDEQAGYMQIMAGSMIGIRNPRAHESEWEDTENHALELLALANHLVCKVRLAEKRDTV